MYSEHEHHFSSLEFIGLAEDFLNVKIGKKYLFPAGTG
jgi:hypothetical protein